MPERNDNIDSVICRTPNARHQPINRLLAYQTLLALFVYQVTKVLRISHRAEPNDGDACLACTFEVRVIGLREHIDSPETGVPARGLFASRSSFGCRLALSNSGALHSERPTQSHMMDVKVDPLLDDLGIMVKCDPRIVRAISKGDGPGRLNLPNRRFENVGKHKRQPVIVDEPKLITLHRVGERLLH